MPPNCSLAEVADVLRTRERFVIMSHIRPDGDALGCELAMAHALRGMGKQVAVWNEDGVPEKFRYLPGWELVEMPPAVPEQWEVAIALDTAVQDRVGRCLEAVSRADLWINIDHHATNPRYGDLAYVDATAPATGQILYELFHSQDIPVTRDMADNLFVAISTDTGSFQYPNTTARTYEIGAELIRAGVRVGELSQRMYESYPRRRLELLRAVLQTVRFTSNDKVASFALPLSTVQAIGAQPDDNEGLIDTIRGVDTVIAAAFIEEMMDGKVRISLRSKNPKVDVAAVCAQFGGGGHVLAAGARTTGTLEEVHERVLAALDAAVQPA